MIRFLVLKSFRNRKMISFLCILSIALSFSLYLLVNKVRDNIENSFTNSISNADLIVGARSGPLQLLLYSIFHMGAPTNNITYKTFQSISELSAVDWTIPLSLGDSYKGFRVVGTNDNFYKFYQFYGDKKLEVDTGKWKLGVFDVILGANVAKKLKHQVNDSIVLSHGLSEESIFNHDDTPFRVIGVLKATGTPVDKSLYISLAGMEALHIGWENGLPSYKEIDTNKYKQENLIPNQITAFILRTKNRIALLGLQRHLSTYKDESLSAIIPAMTLAELWGILDHLEKAFLGISFFVIIIGFFTILITLYMSINERRGEMLILRSLGLSSLSITGILLTESTILSIFGVTTGVFIQYFGILFAGPIVEAWYGIRIQTSVLDD